ncbi:MAG TPA: nucleotide sugar dehydrogenase [Acidimicrobiales bacterium]|nr:nucleotide sugar dehydrogenase [Acidimicrobiales bacterium]
MKVAVFGLGYVGTVTAACLAANGHDVWAVDVDPDKVATVAGGSSPVVEPGLADLVADGIGAGRLHATTSVTDALGHAEVSMICVGTPTTAQGRADLSHVHAVMADIAAGLEAGPPPPSGFHAVVMRSTVPPGTVEALGHGLASVVGGRRQVGMAMCPEFLREGTGIADFYAPPFTVVGTSDQRVADTLERLFGFLGRPLHRVETETAEALKYACNAFHATKISFANEVGRLFGRLGVDSRKVMALFCEDDQLNISARYLRPGFAFGGSCLPKDLRVMLHLARTEGIDLPLLSGTLLTNALGVGDLVERVLEGPGRQVALLGLSFKADSDDLRESPYVHVAETLLGKGCTVRIYDPIINPGALVGTNRQYVESRLPHLRRMLTASATEALADADLAVATYGDPELAAALVAAAPGRILDLDGRLGPEVEALPGYEGFLW